jgi:CelD/BcsL family acetyltransferase involved in cellulose biosynthesis
VSYVIEINELDELADWHSVWENMLPQTTGASFFHTLEWLQTYWKHFGHDQTLRVLVPHSDNQPVGILPLCVRIERYRVGNLRVLTYPLHDWGTFYGPIGPNPAATLLAGLSHVRQTRRDWDLLDLRWVDLESQDLGRTEQAMLEAGFTPNSDVWARAAIVEMQGNWEAFLGSKTPKWRNNFRRYERRLNDRGAVSHLRHRPKSEFEGDGDPRWDLFELCLEIARRSWQGSSSTGTTLSHPRVEPFIRDAHLAAARKGMLDLNLLRIDDDAVAFAYNYHYQGKMQGLRIGFDKERAPDGAGNVLYSHLIRDSIERGDRQYDMGVGSLGAKKHFLSRVGTSYRFTHFPLGLRAQALRVKRMVNHWWTARHPEPAEAQGA